MRTLDQGGTLAIGTAGLSKHTLNTVIPGLGALEQKSEFASGGFYRYGAAAIGTAGFSSTQIGTCTIFQIAGGTAVGGGIALPLDAGAQLTLNEPNAVNKAIPRDTGVYSATLYDSGLLGAGGSGSPTLTQGSYTIDGTGLVEITGTGLTVGSTATGTLFICTAQASAGAFTVPVSVLQQMPVITNQGATGDGTIGTLAVMAITDSSKGQGLFSAPLTGGGTTDQAFFTYSIGTTKMTGFN